MYAGQSVSHQLTGKDDNRDEKEVEERQTLVVPASGPGGPECAGPGRLGHLGADGPRPASLRQARQPDPPSVAILPPLDYVERPQIESGKVVDW